MPKLDNNGAAHALIAGVLSLIPAQIIQSTPATMQNPVLLDLAASAMNAKTKTIIPIQKRVTITVTVAIAIFAM